MWEEWPGGRCMWAGCHKEYGGRQYDNAVPNHVLELVTMAISVPLL